MKRQTTYRGVLNFLYQTIPHAEFMMFPGGAGLERMRYALSLLGNPQDKIRVIHIAGTSGKGSTATLLSYLLQSHKKRVGLSISPFLVDIRERMQIDNAFISQKEFIQFFNEVSFLFQKVEKEKQGKLTYFEFLTALTFYIFWKKKVDYAVMETGMGGWYDATNTVSAKDKICVLTKIGLDHTHILGKTLAEIALQKAMIMQKGNHAIAIQQETSVENIFTRTAKSQGADLEFIRIGKEIQNIKIEESGTVFDYESNQVFLPGIEVSLVGSYQAENAGLALRTMQYLGKRDGFQLSEKFIRFALKHVFFQGRFQILRYKEKRVIVDGAHNPQKMQAFIENVRRIYPGEMFTFFIAVKKGKDTEKMLKIIHPFAKSVYIGSFLLGKQDLVHISQSKKEIRELLKKQHFSCVYELPETATAQREIIEKTKSSIIITGSLYFISSMQPLLHSL